MYSYPYVISPPLFAYKVRIITMNENLALIYQSLPYLLKGCTITIGLVGGALGLGFVIGIPMAAGQV